MKSSRRAARSARCHAQPIVFGLMLIALLRADDAVAQSRTAPASQPITLLVDATDAARGLFHSKMTLPAASGPLTLFYPKWIPGEHGPTGPIANFVGLKLSAAGRPVVWRRDLTDMYAIHCDVPAGASAIDVEFDYLSPTGTEGFTASPSGSSQLAVIDWHLHLLYPQGKPVAELQYAASLRLPPHWNAGGALPVAKRDGEVVTFSPVALERLVDSPVVTGRYYRDVELTPGAKPGHHIDIIADSAAALEIPKDTLEHYQRLVAEALGLYGCSHYERYHFLLTLSDHVSHFGLEHHECSDDRQRERFLVDPELHALGAGLLPHEMTHSWNGKHRRPAGLATSDYQQPMKGELLWVYEGLTEYLGNVLTARSGLYTPEQYRENLAHVAAGLEHRSGRRWRPLQDTCDAAQFLYEAPETQWADWRRGVDFYDEGELIWLEVDVLIRTQTHGSKSLDDFSKLFLGGPSGPPSVKPYTFDDVVAALNQVTPYDWGRFFHDRLDFATPHAPFGGILGSGWNFGYDQEPGELAKLREDHDEQIDLRFSIGLSLGKDGEIKGIVRGSPADKAGVPASGKLLAVNGRKLNKDVMLDALKEAHAGPAPLELLVEDRERFATHKLDYRDGPRYPRLQRDESKPDLLSEIISARASRK